MHNKLTEHGNCECTTNAQQHTTLHNHDRRWVSCVYTMMLLGLWFDMLFVPRQLHTHFGTRIACPNLAGNSVPHCIIRLACLRRRDPIPSQRGRKKLSESSNLGSEVCVCGGVMVCVGVMVCDGV